MERGCDELVSLELRRQRVKDTLANWQEQGVLLGVGFAMGLIGLVGSVLGRAEIYSAAPTMLILVGLFCAYVYWERRKETPRLYDDERKLDATITEARERIVLRQS